MMSLWETLITILLTLMIMSLIPSKWRRTMKCYTKYIFFFVYFAFISIIGFPLCMKHPANCKSMWVYATFMTPVSRVLGIKWDLRNGDKLIGQNTSAVCVANHQSMYDVVGMLLLWKTYSFRCGTVARNLFFWLWPVGLTMWMSGVIFIKRQTGSEKTKQGFNEAVDQLFKKKEKLWVFVEGTRNKNRQHLLPFKKGAFVTAIKYQVPVQPIVFSPFYFIDLQSKRFDSGKVIIEVLNPISTEGLTLDDLDDFIDKTHQVMSEKYQELKHEIRKYIKYEEQKRSLDLGVVGS